MQGPYTYTYTYTEITIYRQYPILYGWSLSHTFLFWVFFFKRAIGDVRRLHIAHDTSRQYPVFQSLYQGFPHIRAGHESNNRRKPEWRAFWIYNLGKIILSWGQVHDVISGAWSPPWILATLFFKAPTLLSSFPSAALLGNTLALFHTSLTAYTYYDIKRLDDDPARVHHHEVNLQRTQLAPLSMSGCSIIEIASHSFLVDSSFLFSFFKPFSLLFSAHPQSSHSGKAAVWPVLCATFLLPVCDNVEALFDPVDVRNRIWYLTPLLFHQEWRHMCLCSFVCSFQSWSV